MAEAGARAHAAERPLIFTIGHSTREFSEVLGMLERNGVTRLVDIRSFPSSRAFPQWNREAIEAALPGTIGYRWLRELGGRRHTRAGVESRNGWWRVKAFRDYADYMANDAFAEGLEQLLHEATEGVPAIMCSEAVPWRCHRRLVTDAALLAGADVTHIMSAERTEPAVLTPAARVDDGVLFYPPDDARAGAPDGTADSAPDDETDRAP